MIFIGVDPGVSGAVAIIDGTKIYVKNVPIIEGNKHRELDAASLADILNENISNTNECLAAIEKVGSMPKQGVASMFSFGFSTGQACGVLAALKIPIIRPRPQEWKKKILNGFPWKGDKSSSIAFIRQRFPDVDLKRTPRCTNFDTGKADALCLALYAKESYSPTAVVEPKETENNDANGEGKEGEPKVAPSEIS
jgi:crossover junction endodeoxyribonuclease RuvC